MLLLGPSLSDMMYISAALLSLVVHCLVEGSASVELLACCLQKQLDPRGLGKF